MEPKSSDRPIDPAILAEMQKNEDEAYQWLLNGGGTDQLFDEVEKEWRSTFSATRDTAIAHMELEAVGIDSALSVDELKTLWIPTMRAITIGLMLLIDPPPFMPPKVIMAIVSAVSLYSKMRMADQMLHEANGGPAKPSQGTTTPTPMDPLKMAELFSGLNPAKRES
jgi:hypothetical protein